MRANHPLRGESVRSCPDSDVGVQHRGGHGVSFVFSQSEGFFVDVLTDFALLYRLHWGFRKGCKRNARITRRLGPNTRWTGNICGTKCDGRTWG